MQIDLVITELFVGGAEKCLTQLATGLVSRGEKVRVFSLGSLPTGDQALFVNQLDDAGIQIDTADANGFFQAPRAISRLKQWLASSPADLVQTFLFHANVLGMYAAKGRFSGPVVGGLRVADPQSWRKWVERRAVDRMDRLVCVSQATARFAQQSLGCPPSKCPVIPNSIDVNQWSQINPIDWSTIGWPSDSIVTLFVGRLTPQKNLGLLQRSIDQVAPAGSNRRLLIIGDGIERDAISRWTDTVGSDRVKRLPWQADVRPYVRGARLLVLPSLYEGMPNVVLEAMAAGIPVVTSRVEGCEELIGASRMEQSFDLGDDDGFVAKVNRFQDDAAFANKMGEQNQQRARIEFGIDTMVDRYRDLYRDCLL